MLRFPSATSTPPSSGTPLPPHPQIFPYEIHLVFVHFFQLVFGSDKRAPITVDTSYENRPGEEWGVWFFSPLNRLGDDMPSLLTSLSLSLWICFMNCILCYSLLCRFTRFSSYRRDYMVAVLLWVFGYLETQWIYDLIRNMVAVFIPNAQWRMLSFSFRTECQTNSDGSSTRYKNVHV